MKIKRELPQFEREKTLLIVGGEQRGLLYKIYDGEIEKIAELEIPVGKERVYASGSIVEPQKQEVRKQFLKVFSNAIIQAYARQKFSTVYIFTPAYMASALRKQLPSMIRKRIKASFPGNYTKRHHPFEFLKLIGKKMRFKKVSVAPHEEEARKIMRRKR